ncbi:MAG: DUF6585 family protein [Polyangiaceae bacterium]
MTETAKKPAWGEEKNEGPKEFSRVTSLGAFEKAWLGRERFPKGYMFMIVGAILGTIGGVMAFVAQSMFAFIPFGSFFVIFFPIGVFFTLQSSGGASMVATYDEGFAALVKSKVSLWAWDDIQTVVTKTDYRGGTTGGAGVNLENHKVSIVKENGETVLLFDTELKDVVKLITIIKDHLSAKLLPSFQKSYDAGQTLTFGPVHVSNKLLEADKRRLEWDAIRNVVVTDGSLVVNPKEGEPVKIRVSLIPNVDLLCALIGVKYTRSDLAYRW